MAHIQYQNLLNKLINLPNKINQFFLINKTSLLFMVRANNFPKQFTYLKETLFTI